MNAARRRNGSDPGAPVAVPERTPHPHPPLAPPTPAPIEVEISKFVDAVIERHLAAVPDGMRATVREQLYGMVGNDPTVAAVLDDLRSAVTRG